MKLTILPLFDFTKHFVTYDNYFYSNKDNGTVWNIDKVEDDLVCLYTINLNCKVIERSISIELFEERYRENHGFQTKGWMRKEIITP